MSNTDNHNIIHVLFVLILLFIGVHFCWFIIHLDGHGEVPEGEWECVEYGNETVINSTENCYTILQIDNLIIANDVPNVILIYNAEDNVMTQQNCFDSQLNNKIKQLEKIGYKNGCDFGYGCTKYQYVRYE